MDSCSVSDFNTITHWEIICLFSTAATTTVIRFTALPQFFTKRATWEIRLWLYHNFAKYNMYFPLSISFPLLFRSVYLWPTSLTMATIGWVFTHLSTWPPFFIRGRTWSFTPSHPCSSHTNTSSFSLNKGIHSGRCVCMSIWQHDWACAFLQMSVQIYCAFIWSKMLLLYRLI